MKLTQWNEKLSKECSDAVTRKLALWCTGQIKDQGLQEHLAHLIERDDFAGLCAFESVYSGRSCSDVRFERQALAFFQKRADLEIGIDKTAVAKKQFLMSEARCSETNDIFKKWSAGSFQFEPAVERWLFIAQQKIATVLGDVPNLSDIKPVFGPGATTQLTKRTASSRRKLGETFACSEDLVPRLSEVLEECQAWIAPYFKGDSETATVSVELHPGIVNFVPKNAKTDRAIVVEPSLNTFFQIGIGQFIADRLRLIGVDIRDQTRNQDLAKDASIDGGLATLDLSNASDRIARELVAHLLPFDWFLLLDDFRTETVLLDGEPIKQQKFSSMGNGFTFPLETLIFWGLSAAVVSRDELTNVSVYGDDIIVPTHRFDDLTHLLHVCGFEVNISKSFSSGPFRESCGKDYFLGIPIRPVYQKDRLSGELLFVLHNFFVRNALPELALICLDSIDPVLQLWGPDGYGDGHLIGDHEKPRKRLALAKDPRVSSGWSGYTFDTFSWVGRKDFVPYKGDFVFPMYQCYLGSDNESSDDRLFRNFVRDASLVRKYWHPASVESLLSRLKSVRCGSNWYNKQGFLGTTIPGKTKYKRVSIYTFG